MDASSQHLAGANLRLGPPPPAANTHRLAAPGYALFGAAAYPRAANFRAVGYAPMARGQPFGGDATANPLSAGGYSNAGRVHRFRPAGYVHTAHGHPFGGDADANSLSAGGYSNAGSVHPFRTDGRPLDPTRFTAPAASYVAAHQQLGATDRDLGTGAGAAGHAIFGAPGYSVHHLSAAADHPLGPGAGAAGHAIFDAPGYSVHQLGAAADHPLGPGAGAADHDIFGAPGYSGGDTVHHLGAEADHPLGPGAGASDHTVAADHFAPIGAAPGARSSGSADPFAHISEVVVEQVWMENSAEVFTTVLNKLRQPRRRLFVALDLEYVADASTDVFYRPICNSFMAPDGLPRDLQSYMFHRRACFPAVYDIRFLAQQFQDINLLPSGCNGELGLLPFLRCYRTISDHVEFRSISSAAQGKLMVG